MASSFALEIGCTFDARIGDQIECHFLRLKIDAFQRRAFERSAHAAAAGSAVVDVAAQQGRDGKRTRDNDGLVFQPFVFEEALGVGDVYGKVIEIGLRDRGANFFGIADPHE